MKAVFQPNPYSPSRRRSSRPQLLVACATFVCAQANAEVRFLFSEAEFDALVASGPVTDFESAPLGSTPQLILNGNTFEPTGAGVDVFVAQDTNPAFAVPTPLPTGNVLTGNGLEDFEIVFGTPTDAVGFDTYENTTGSVTVQVFATGMRGETLTYDLANPAEVGFLGIVADAPIERIRWTAADAAENTGIDNLRQGVRMWRPFAPLNFDRRSHTAMLLQDGRVLVAGGLGGGTLVTTAEIVDPTDGSVRVTGDMQQGRYFHTATLLPDGRVLLAGGFDENNAAVASTEIFDPATGTWSPGPAMALTRARHREMTLPDGSLLLPAGRGASLHSNADRLDMQTGEWMLTAPMITNRQDYAGVLLNDGRAFVAGGFSRPLNEGSIATDAVEIFDPVAGTWSASDPLPAPQWLADAALLPDGRVLVAGGLDVSNDSTTTSAIWNPGDGSWSPVGDLSNARHFYASGTLPDGRVVVLGGQDDDLNPIGPVEAFDVTSESWQPAGELAFPRPFATATSLPGSVMVIGGFFATVGVEVYDVCTSTIDPTGVNTDGDDDPDACDPDDDNDELPDSFEAAIGLNGVDASDALLDLDGDTFGNLVEYQAGTDADDAGSAPAANPKVQAVSSTLPTSRSVEVGTPATVFATIINTAAPALGEDNRGFGCGIRLTTPVTGEFTYRQTNPVDNSVRGQPDSPAALLAGAAQTYVIAITPTATLPPTEFEFEYGCANGTPAPTVVGLNTLLLSASATPVPDIVALAATVNSDGRVHGASPGDTAFFSVATVNVGTTGALSVSADTGTATLPLALALCQTDPTTGVCINPTTPQAASVDVTIDADATPTFAVFVTGSDVVPFDPANSRVFVRFDEAGTTRGATSVAVSVDPPPP